MFVAISVNTGRGTVMKFVTVALNRKSFTTDSSAVNMQHMAVVKDFRLSATMTNFITVPRPVLTLMTTNIIRWAGVSNLTYTVQGATNLNNWLPLGTATSTTTNFSFTNTQPVTARRFYRVTWP